MAGISCTLYMPCDRQVLSLYIRAQFHCSLVMWYVLQLAHYLLSQLKGILTRLFQLFLTWVHGLSTLLVNTQNFWTCSKLKSDDHKVAKVRLQAFWPQCITGRSPMHSGWLGSISNFYRQNSGFAIRNPTASSRVPALQGKVSHGGPWKVSSRKLSQMWHSTCSLSLSLFFFFFLRARSE